MGSEAVVSDVALLPGEIPESPYTDDAAHWVAVYSELVVTSQGVIDQAHLQHFQGRLSFWRRRQKNLRDASA